MDENTYNLRSFAVSNFRSIKNTQKIMFNDSKVLAVYGSNASGKTNLARALQFMRWFISNSANAGISGVPYEPFRLNVNSRKAPSKFEIEFGSNEEIFLYKFSIDSKAVKSEELIDLSSSRPKIIFKRTADGLGENAVKYGFGKQLFASTRENTLVITKAQENNNAYARKVFTMIESLRVITIGDGNLKGWAAEILKRNPHAHDRVLEYLRDADLWIRDFSIEELDMPEDLISALPFSDDEKQRIRTNKLTSVKTKHAVRDDDGNIVDYDTFDMGDQESAGTNNFFDMIMPIIEAIDRSLVLYIDEFGSSLHPDLAQLIIKIFKNNKQSNAQLIVNTHDTSLMDNDDLLSARDILFAEKNFAEESIFTALKEKRTYKSTDQGKLEKRYRTGMYGATPKINKTESHDEQ